MTPKRPEATCLIDDRRLVAVGVGREAGRVLAALARVGAPADAVHRDRQRLVRFLGDRTEAHRSGAKSLDDLGGGLDVLERDRLVRELEVEQAAQRAQRLVHVVDRFGVLPVVRPTLVVDRVLQPRDSVRIEQVLLAADAVVVLAADVEIDVGAGDRQVGAAVPLEAFLRDHVEADALDLRGRAGEELVDDLAIEPDGLEDLGAVIGLHGGDAHLRHRLENAFLDRLAVVEPSLGCVDVAGDFAVAVHLVDRLVGHVGVDGVGAVADQQAEVHHLPRFTGFDDQADLAARRRCE